MIPKHAIYNRFGQPITGVPELQDPSFGHYDEEGSLRIHWAEDNEFVDDRGFDKSYKGTNGFTDDDYVLPKGTVIARYGPPTGYVTTLVGTPYDKLGHACKEETMEYHEYIVVADGLKVKCAVIRGKVAPMFNSPGGAWQFYHENSVQGDIDAKKIEETFEWMRRR